MSELKSTSGNDANRKTTVAKNTHSRLVSAWIHRKTETLTLGELKDPTRFAALNQDEARCFVEGFLKICGKTHYSIEGLRVENGLRSGHEGFEAKVKLVDPSRSVFVLRTFETPNTSQYHFEWDLLPFSQVTGVTPLDSDAARDKLLRSYGEDPNNLSSLEAVSRNERYPLRVRIAAGLKAVNLTGNEPTLDLLARNSDNPQEVQRAAGMKVVEKTSSPPTLNLYARSYGYHEDVRRAAKAKKNAAET